MQSLKKHYVSSYTLPSLLYKIYSQLTLSLPYLDSPLNTENKFLYFSTMK